MVNIAELRIRKGKISQEELAKELGVSKSTIYKWENDITIISGKNLIIVCKYFGVSADEILGLKKREG